MTDPRTLAQREGPEAMEALVREIIRNAGWGFGPDAIDELTGAARKLAEMEPVTPQWPTAKLWAWFWRKTGAFHTVGGQGIESDQYGVSFPCRVVPADAVVLTREEAATALEKLSVYYEGPEIIALRAALRREREGT